MSRLSKRIRRVYVLAALLAGALFLGSIATALEVGEKAPDFLLPSTMGGVTSLSMFQGKKVVLLEFYGADFSPT
jgi:AhpC/TSA family